MVTPPAILPPWFSGKRKCPDNLTTENILTKKTIIQDSPITQIVTESFIDLYKLADCAASQSPIRFKIKVKPPQKFNWTEKKCKELLARVDEIGVINKDSWKVISELMHFEYSDSVSNALSKKYSNLRPWSKNDDEQLLILRKQFNSDWKAIASEMHPPRSHYSCRTRWLSLKKINATSKL